MNGRIDGATCAAGLAVLTSLVLGILLGCVVTVTPLHYHAAADVSFSEFHSFVGILAANTRVAAVLLGGIPTLGSLTLIQLGNVSFTTAILAHSASVNDTPWWEIAAVLLPHGLLELASFTTIAFVGVRLSYYLLLAVCSSNWAAATSSNVCHTCSMWIPWSVLAALIESTITATISDLLQCC